MTKSLRTEGRIRPHSNYTLKVFEISSNELVGKIRVWGSRVEIEAISRQVFNRIKDEIGFRWGFYCPMI